MDLQPLYEVKERLERAAVAGTGLLGEDFRLKRALEGLATLAAASPVFAKIHAGVEALLSAPPEKRGGALLDALALVDAVAYTQAAVGMPGALEPLPPGTGTCQDVSYSQLHPLLEALTGTGGGRMAVVQEAFQAHPEYFSDYRVLPALVRGLRDSYGELAELNASILGQQGPGIAPLLEEGFDPAGGRAMARRVEVLAQAAGAQANDFFLAQLPQAKKEVRLALIGALGCSPANTQLLLELCRKERKGEALDRARCALLQLDTPEAADYLTQLAKTEQDAMLVYLANTSSQAGSRFTAMIFNHILDQMEADPEAVLPAEVWKRLKVLCSVLVRKTGPEVCALYHRLAGLSQQQLDRLVEGARGKPVVMRFSCYNGHEQGTLRLLAGLTLSDTLKNVEDLELCRLAIQLQEQAGDDFLAPALTARLISRTPEDSYTWAEGHIFWPRLLGKRLWEEALHPLRVALGNLNWVEQDGVYRYLTAWYPQPVQYAVPSVPPLDIRWFSLLTQMGRSMDHTLIALLHGRKLPGLPRRVLEHLYRSALSLGDYSMVLRIVELLGEFGWTEWDGFAAQWAVTLGGSDLSYWEVFYIIRSLPIPARKKAEQLRQVNQLVSAGKVRLRNNGYWPASEVQKCLDEWEQAAQREGEENHV